MHALKLIAVNFAYSNKFLKFHFEEIMIIIETRRSHIQVNYHSHQTINSGNSTR